MPLAVPAGAGVPRKAQSPSPGGRGAMRVTEPPLFPAGRGSEPCRAGLPLCMLLCSLQQHAPLVRHGAREESWVQDRPTHCRDQRPARA